MKVTILGSGTSTGVPVPGCRCRVCTSADPHDKRLRTAAFVELPPAGAGRPALGLLIDAGPDMRQQVLRAGIMQISAVLLTHTHADHIFGIDDLRSFNYTAGGPIPLYATEPSTRELKRIFQYIFLPDPEYRGSRPAQLQLSEIIPGREFEIEGRAVQPLPLLHGGLPVTGFRIGDFAYLTDCSEIPAETRRLLAGTRIIILDGLRERPHPTHFSHAQALAEIEKIGPEQAFLTHITHEVLHAEADAKLRELSGGIVGLAYDGLTLEL